MIGIGETSKVYKVDLSAELLGDAVANSHCNGRLADATGTQEGNEPLLSKAVSELAEHRLAPNHPSLPRGQSPEVPTALLVLRSIIESNNGPNERVSPSLNVGDVPVSELAIPERLTDGSHMDPEAALLDVHIGPDVIDEFLLGDHLARAVGKIDQNIKRAAAKGKHDAVASQHPLVTQ
jgi:hypothetical protein